MNIGRALLVQSGFNHVKTIDRNDITIDNLYTRLQWLISYRGACHADTIQASKLYNAYCKAYTERT
jgi:hypothetical protein